MKKRYRIIFYNCDSELDKLACFYNITNINEPKISEIINEERGIIEEYYVSYAPNIHKFGNVEYTYY